VIGGDREAQGAPGPSRDADELPDHLLGAVPSSATLLSARQSHGHQGLEGAFEIDAGGAAERQQVEPLRPAAADRAQGRVRKTCRIAEPVVLPRASRTPGRDQHVGDDPRGRPGRHSDEKGSRDNRLPRRPARPPTMASTSGKSQPSVRAVVKASI